MKITSKIFGHTFPVLEPSEDECLLSLDFLETNKFNPMFSEEELRLNRDFSANFLHRTAPLQSWTYPVMTKVKRETSFIPCGHEENILGKVDLDGLPLLKKQKSLKPLSLLARNITFRLSNSFLNFKKMPSQHVSSITKKIEFSRKSQQWEHLPSCKTTRWPRTMLTMNRYRSSLQPPSLLSKVSSIKRSQN